jgi:hypothetical protein
MQGAMGFSLLTPAQYGAHAPVAARRSVHLYDYLQSLAYGCYVIAWALLRRGAPAQVLTGHKKFPRQYDCHTWHCSPWLERETVEGIQIEKSIQI